MTLEGFTSIPEQATAGGAPIDAFQADALRRNDALFEQIMQSLMSSPFMPTGIDGDIADPEPRQFVNAKNITVNFQRNLTPGIPLIWMAREKITLKHTINARGAGAQAGQTGDFGGGGGGGATAGQACLMPFSATDFVLAASAPGAPGLNLITTDAWKLSRIFLFLPWLKGGAAGSDAGGSGGGVVCLCAPVIELVGANGIIDARGSDAVGNNKGGGGGGLIILIARQIVNATSGTTILTNGGAPAGGTGQAGGNGHYVEQLFK